MTNVTSSVIRVTTNASDLLNEESIAELEQC